MRFPTVRSPRGPASLLVVLAAVASTATLGAAPRSANDANTIVDPAVYQALHFRFLGPYRGGRSGAVAGVPGEPHMFYLGASGGLFKTTNAGETWNVISDDDFEVSNIGAIAVAPSDANVIYVGTGQKTIRTLWSVRDQIGDRLDRMRVADIEVAEIEAAARPITERLDEFEEMLWQPKAEGSNDLGSFPPGFDTQIAYLFSMTDRSNHRPTTGQRLRFEELHGELQELLPQLESFYASDVAELDRMMRDSGATMIQVPRQQQ